MIFITEQDTDSSILLKSLFLFFKHETRKDYVIYDSEQDTCPLFTPDLKNNKKIWVFLYAKEEYYKNKFIQL